MGGEKCSIQRQFLYSFGVILAGSRVFMRAFSFVCVQDMLGQATSILTSSVGSGIVTAHKKLLQQDRVSQGLASGSSAGAFEISDDAYTASVTMVLNGVNSFLYQMVLLPLYILIAMQKTIVCTSNDIFGIFDVSGFVVRVGRPDLQNASDISSGVCLSAFFESKVRL